MKLLIVQDILHTLTENLKSELVRISLDEKKVRKVLTFIINRLPFEQGINGIGPRLKANHPLPLHKTTSKSHSTVPN